MSESGHEYESGDMREWGVYNSGHDMRAAVTQVPSLLWPHHTLLQPGVSGSCETMVWTGAALQWWPQAAAVTSSEWSVPGLWPVMERMGGSGHLVCEHVVQSAAVSASANMILTMMQWLQWLWSVLLWFQESTLVVAVSVYCESLITIGRFRANYIIAISCWKLC